MRDRASRRRVMLLVSKSDHCLVDILYRWRTGELADDPDRDRLQPSARDLRHLDFGEIPFHHLPVTRETKREQEAAVWKLVEETSDRSRRAGALHADPVRRDVGKSVGPLHQHPSLVPAGLQGREPYHQAHERGVKLIGATAHYVTGDLDEGPIIEQDVERISHRDTPEDLVRKGRDIERRVLARAMRHHLEDRVILNGRKTVVFMD